MMNESKNESQGPDVEASSNAIALILKVLREGENIFKTGEFDDIILVLGRTGVGKSSLTHFIAGDNKKLVSEETPDGSFTIRDLGEKKICSRTLISCTIVPELTLDMSTKTPFYDCPGFSDTRSAAHDITATYFNRQVISTAKRVKIVFVIDYGSVRTGGDRSNFIKMLRSVVSMIPEIGKFADSLSLIITKVENTYPRGKLVTDAKIIEGIAAFLKSVKTELKDSPDHSQLIESANIFIDALLTKNGSTYSRLGIFRRPDAPGPLIGLPELQAEKAWVRQIILNNTNYTPCTLEDFKYVIAEEWKLELIGLFKEIPNLIASEIKDTGRQVQNAYSKLLLQQINHHDGIDQKIETATDAYKRFSALKSFSRLLDLETLMAEIGSTCMILKIAQPEPRQMAGVVKLGKYVDFISSVSSLTLFEKRVLSEGLTDLVGSFLGMKRWFEFMKHLQSAVETYGVQKNFEQYSAMVDELLDHTREQAVRRNEFDEALKRFINQVTMDSGVPATTLAESLGYTTEMAMDDVKLGVLNEVLRENLKSHPTSYNCEKERFVISGKFVTANVTNRLNSCSVKLLHVFATSKVFIEEDINAVGRELQISIIAPTWEVIGERRIKVDGSQGSGWPMSAGSLGGYGSSGRNGLAGKPGGNAGSFFGLGERCSRCDHLTVSANGGQGGNGQDGGNGEYGEDGRKPRYPYPDNGATCVREGTESTIGKSIGTIVGSILTLGQAIPLLFKEVKYQWYCRVNGRRGQRGGVGGNGGLGGLGGYPGVIKILLADGSHPGTSCAQGQPGQNGTKGMNGGKGLPGYILKYIVSETAIEKTIPEQDVEYSLYSDQDLRPPGTPDTTIHSTKNPKPAIIFNEPFYAVNLFKKQVRGNFILPSSTNQFLQHLETNSNVTALYGTLGLINDVHHLEMLYTNAKDKNSLLMWYAHLSRRIREYQTNPRHNENNEEHRRVLNYLLASTLSTSYRMSNSGINADWVINIEGFLDLVMREVDDLRDFNRLVVKSSIKNSYLKEINNRLDEIRNLVDENLMPELDRISDEKDKIIDQLLVEIEADHERARQESTDLIRRKRMLGRQMIEKKVIGALKLVGSALVVLGPVGSAVATLIKVGSVVGESFVGARPEEVHISVLPSGVRTTLENMAEMVDDEWAFFKQQTFILDGQLAIYLSNHSDSEFFLKMKQITSTIAQAQVGNDKAEGFLLKMVKWREDLETALQMAKLKFDEEKSENPAENRKTAELLNCADRFFSVLEAGKDVYSSIQETGIALSEYDAAMRAVQQKMKQLRTMNLVIYQHLMPLCRALYEEVKVIGMTTNSRTQATLDVSKWKVQSVLRDAQHQLRGMTEGFKAQGPMTQYIEKLEYAMSTMIQLFQRAQEYQDRARLVDVLATMLYSDDSEISVSSSLGKAVSELKLTIQSNVVLTEYEKAINGAGQYVFPFGEKYLEHHRIQPMPRNNVSSLISLVNTQISTLQKTLQRDKNTLSQFQDKNLFPRILFSSSGNLKAPFFLWTHEDYGEDITKVMRGQEVVLNADITQGVDQNAIKFDRIGVRFILRDEMEQKRFDEVMNDFRVSLTHLGDSYYRCGKKLYVIDHSVQHIEHSVNEDSGGEYSQGNGVYEKITKNFPLFSPYTAWRIKLKNVTASMDVLAKYSDLKADLELVGRGQYVDHEVDSTICGEQLSRFYSVTDGISKSKEAEVDEVEHDFRTRRSVDGESARLPSGSSLLNAQSFVGSFWQLLTSPHKVTAAEDSSAANSVLYDASSFTGTSPGSSRSPYENHQRHVTESLNFNDLDVQSNLLLMNVLMRKYASPAKTSKVLRRERLDDEYAHNMAYRAYVP